MDDIKEKYSFSSWPVDSIVEEDAPVNCRLDGSGEFELLERRSLFWPKSYEDIYRSREDENVRISVTVINCESFIEAKEQLANQLSQCAAYRLPHITEQLNNFSADIAFGAADGSGEAIQAVRGRTVILIRNIGRKSIDLIPVYGMLDEKIVLSQQRGQ